MQSELAKKIVRRSSAPAEPETKQPEVTQEKAELQKVLKQRLAESISSTAQPSSAVTSTTDHVVSTQVKEMRKQAKEKEKEYQAQREQLLKRVYSGPTLLDRYKFDQDRVESRRKALLAIKEGLDRAGIKDYKRFFDPDELADLGLKF